MTVLLVFRKSWPKFSKLQQFGTSAVKLYPQRHVMFAAKCSGSENEVLPNGLKLFRSGRAHLIQTCEVAFHAASLLHLWLFTPFPL